MSVSTVSKHSSEPDLSPTWCNKVNLYITTARVLEKLGSAPCVDLSELPQVRCFGDKTPGANTCH